MSGYLKSSAQMAEEAGISSTFVAKKAHTYLKKKNLDTFYLVLPPIVEGYDPRSVAYHYNTAVINVPGNSKPFTIRNLCQGMHCPKCASLRASHGKDGSAPNDQRKRSSTIFLAYPVYPKKDGSFRFGSNAAPHLVEYYFSYSKEKRIYINPDWDNLLEQVRLAEKKGFTSQNPDKAIIIKVEAVKQEKNGLTKTLLKHTYLEGQSMTLPENWKEQINSLYPFDDIHMNLSGSDLEILVNTSDKIAELSQAPTNEPEQTKGSRLRKIAELYNNYHTIKDEAFSKILAAMEKRGEKKEGSSPTPYTKTAYASEGPVTEEFFEKPDLTPSSSHEKQEAIAEVKSDLKEASVEKTKIETKAETKVEAPSSNEEENKNEANAYESAKESVSAIREKIKANLAANKK